MTPPARPTGLVPVLAVIAGLLLLHALVLVLLWRAAPQQARLAEAPSAPVTARS